MSASSEKIHTDSARGKDLTPLEAVIRDVRAECDAANRAAEAAPVIYTETEVVECFLESGDIPTRTVEVLTVTPEMAAIMLKHNVANRPLVRSRVEKHIQRLRNGTFRLLHQGIAFARDCRLIDGQHRLTAVVEAGIAAPFTVTFGAEVEEFNCVDQGGVRTAADLLAIDGKHQAHLRSSIVAVLMVLERASLRGAQEVAEYTRKLDAEGDLLDRAVSLGNRMRKVTNATSAAVAYYVIGKSGSPRDIIDAFWEGMASGENLSGARLRLREWLMHDEISERNSRNLTVKRAAVIINAWNSWRRRRKTVDFTWDHTTSLPAVRP